MWLWRQITYGLRSLLDRGQSDEDVTDEVRHYFAEAEAELVAGGAALEEARRTVRLRYGDSLRVREDVRAYGWETALEELYSDLRLTARRLRRNPGFTVVVTLILGLGIGATTAILSAVRPVIFDPLPYPNGDRILAISDRSEGSSTVPVTFGTYREIVERSRVFEALSVFKPWQPTLTGRAEPERLQGQRVTAGYLDVLGIAPVLGPGFDVIEDRPDGANQVVLSDGLWRRRFDSDPAIVGRVVHLDAEPYVVVGVMGRAFESITLPGSQAWGLLQYDPLHAGFDTREWGHHLGMVGRLDAAATLDDARRQLSEVASHPVPEFHRPEWASLAAGLSVLPLRDSVMADTRPTMLVLLGAVALLLMIACVNLTILLLARGLRRQGELAVRAALGAGRNRLVRQILTESLALAGLGGVLGVLLAQVGLGALLAASPPTLFRGEPSGAVGLDAGTLGFALALTTAVGVLVGLVPAWSRSGGPLNASVQDAGRRSTARHRALPRALVVVEVALAMVLLVGAGLLVHSTERLFSAPQGFDPTSLVVMQIYATGLERGDAVIHRFWDQALDAVESVPGIRSAVFTNQLPLSGDAEVFGVTLDGEDPEADAGSPAYRYAVTPGYVEAMSILLIRGRSLGEQDDLPGAPPVVVVSTSLASQLFQDRDPLGERIRVGPFELDPYTIVGVVDDVKQESLAADPGSGVYVTSRQWHWADRVRWLVVRADQPLSTLVPAVRRAVWSVDGDQPIVRAQSMEDVVLRSENRRRFVMTVLMAFALFAVTLAALGLYGVLSGSVAERGREMGVRAALGASRNDIRTLVVRQGMTLTALGVGLGLLGAASASELLSSLLFGVARLDPVTYLAAALLISAVSAGACWLPASRAAKVDALVMLRAD
jgi:putative ABC transport system permease protein